jgi:hypothetical protein
MPIQDGQQNGPGCQTKPWNGPQQAKLRAGKVGRVVSLCLRPKIESIFPAKRVRGHETLQYCTEHAMEYEITCAKTARFLDRQSESTIYLSQLSPLRTLITSDPTQYNATVGLPDP